MAENEANITNENDAEEVYRIESGNYLPEWAHSLSIISVIGTFVFLVVVIGERMMGVRDSIVAEDIYEDVVLGAVVALSVFSFVAYLIFTCKSVYMFNATRRMQFNGYVLMGKLKGGFSPMEMKGGMLAFLRFSQSQEFNFMGLSKNKIDEEMYCLRLVRSREDYDTIVSTSKFEQLPELVRMAKAMARVYGVKYCDYVKDMYRRESVII